VGVAAWRLGAGRSRPGEAVQAAAGVEIEAHIGDEVRAGDVLARLHTDTAERMPRAIESLTGSWRFAAPGTAVPPRRLVQVRLAVADRLPPGLSPGGSARRDPGPSPPRDGAARAGCAGPSAAPTGRPRPAGPRRRRGSTDGPRARPAPAAVRAAAHG